MLSLGVVDIVMIVFLLATLALGQQRRQYALFFFVFVVYLLIMSERLAPGFFQTIGNAVRGIDVINNQGPHLTINPVITFK